MIKLPTALCCSLTVSVAAGGITVEQLSRWAAELESDSGSEAYTAKFEEATRASLDVEFGVSSKTRTYVSDGDSFIFYDNVKGEGVVEVWAGGPQYSFIVTRQNAGSPWVLSELVQPNGLDSTLERRGVTSGAYRVFTKTISQIVGQDEFSLAEPSKSEGSDNTVRFQAGGTQYPVYRDGHLDFTDGGTKRLRRYDVVLEYEGGETGRVRGEIEYDLEECNYGRGLSRRAWYLTDESVGSRDLTDILDDSYAYFKAEYECLEADLQALSIDGVSPGLDLTKLASYGIAEPASAAGRAGGDSAVWWGLAVAFSIAAVASTLAGRKKRSL